MSEQLATPVTYETLNDLLNEPHEEVNSVLILENVVHADNEWMLNVVEDIFFEFDVVELFVINDSIFSNAFHGVDLMSVHVFY
jgi:hypothetical protein